MVEGRLIAARVGRGKSEHWLYLFTTLELSMDEIVALYGRRWNVETDLPSLKRTVWLHHIHAKSQATMEKEILMAISAQSGASGHVSGPAGAALTLDNLVSVMFLMSLKARGPSSSTLPANRNMIRSSLRF